MSYYLLSFIPISFTNAWLQNSSLIHSTKDDNWNHVEWHLGIYKFYIKKKNLKLPSTVVHTCNLSLIYKMSSEQQSYTEILSWKKNKS